MKVHIFGEQNFPDIAFKPSPYGQKTRTRYFRGFPLLLVQPLAAIRKGTRTVGKPHMHLFWPFENLSTQRNGPYVVGVILFFVVGVDKLMYPPYPSKDGEIF